MSASASVLYLRAVHVRLLAVAAFAISGCTCSTRLDPVSAKLTAAAQLQLPDSWVGGTSTAMLEVRNEGGATTEADVQVDAPFSADPAHLVVAAHSSSQLTVRFAPTAAGPASATLSLGPLRVALSGRGVDPPDCTPTACTSSQFDFDAGSCAVTTLPDDSTCQLACVVDGHCRGGVCVGTTAQSCNDGDACSDDGCATDGTCTHQPRMCPGDTAHCLAPTCDVDAGCAMVPAEDGTLCGVDDCLATTVQICIGGQCVSRPRPAGGRCANTWVPVGLPPRGRTTLAYDAARQRVVLFGGISFGLIPLDDTWEWDGQQWELQTPTSRPPARSGHVMAYDSIRQRVVLFGGGFLSTGQFNDTWEWDGTTWVQRSVTTAPSMRTGAVMASDTTRHRLVLYGGNDQGTAATDTWEWDGSTWQQRQTSAHPTDLQAMAFDGARGRMVAVSSTTDTVWEYDGADWHGVSPDGGPGPRINAGLAYDSTRHRIELVGGVTADPQNNGVQHNDLWEWNGTGWAQRQVMGEFTASTETLAVYDEARQRLVVKASTSLRDGIWELGAAGWVDLTMPTPAGRGGVALTWDEQRQQALAFGGQDAIATYDDTWTLDGGRWQRLSPAHTPPARNGAMLVGGSAVGGPLLYSAQLNSSFLNDAWSWTGSDWVDAGQRPPVPIDSHAAYDEARGTVVLSGGVYTGPDNETWTYDGATWTLASTAGPTQRTSPLAYDAKHQQTVLFGGLLTRPDGGQGPDAQTWAWDGAAWTELNPAHDPGPRDLHGLVYDPDRQTVVLFGGSDGQAWANDTWEFDGTDWSQRFPTRSPPPTVEPSMMYDRASHHLLMLSETGTWVLLP
ncbi:MAG: hypothetical protein QM723_26125 [Myxococcaceae bacterium]